MKDTRQIPCPTEAIPKSGGSVPTDMNGRALFMQEQESTMAALTAPEKGFLLALIFNPYTRILQSSGTQVKMRITGQRNIYLGAMYPYGGDVRKATNGGLPSNPERKGMAARFVQTVL